MKNFIFAGLLIIVSVCFISAQDKKKSKGNDRNQIIPTSLTEGSGSSPFRELPKANDHNFVRDEQEGALDTGCTYHAGGPLRIVIPINRVITKLDGTAVPDDYNEVILKQIQSGYLSAKLRLQMPVYDVDPSEIDEVYFNGHFVGNLHGEDGAWVMNDFEVPIEKVVFGNFTGDTTESSPSENEIRIDIDTANEGWCTAIDWASASFEAMSPIILIHGNSSDGKFFERQGLTEPLDEAGLLYDNSLDFEPSSNYIEEEREENGVIIKPNNYQLNDHLKNIVKVFGVDSLHLVTHSKGGLDTRSYLEMYQPANNKDFKILSLTTIAAPHAGSILADIVTERTKVVDQADRIEYDENFPSFSRQVFAINGNALPGHYNLTTGFVRKFNERNVPNLANSGIQFNVIAADADLNGNGAIGLAPTCLANESDQLVRETIKGGSATRAIPTGGVATRMYKIIRDIQSVNVQINTVTRYIEGVEVTFRVPKFISTPTLIPQVNDTLVGKHSGLGLPYFQSLVDQSNGQKKFFEGCSGANHANIPGKTAEDVISWIKTSDRSKGDWNR